MTPVEICRTCGARVIFGRLTGFGATGVHLGDSVGSSSLWLTGVIHVENRGANWRLDVLHELAHWVCGGLEREHYTIPFQWALCKLLEPHHRVRAHNEMRRHLADDRWCGPYRALCHYFFSGSSDQCATP